MPEQLQYQGRWRLLSSATKMVCHISCEKCYIWWKHLVMW
jgi:hypothetical protein